MSITIRPYMAMDVPTLQEIAAAVFGRGYGTHDLFERQGNSILVLKHDHTPIGFAVHRAMTDEAMRNIADGGVTLPDVIHLHHTHRKSVEEIKSIAVAPRFQQQGLGGQLMEYMLDTLDRLGRSTVLPAWRTNGWTNLAPLLARHDFVKAGELKDIWKNECEAGAFACPVRVPTRKCACSAVIYTRVAL